MSKNSSRAIFKATNSCWTEQKKYGDMPKANFGSHLQSYVSCHQPFTQAWHQQNLSTTKSKNRKYLDLSHEIFPCDLGSSLEKLIEWEERPTQLILLAGLSWLSHGLRSIRRERLCVFAKNDFGFFPPLSTGKESDNEGSKDSLL